MIRDAIVAHGKPAVKYVPELKAACAWIVREAKPGDLILTLGAGDVGRCGERILTMLAGK